MACASLATYPQLASINTNDGALTALVLGNLLGTSTSLTVVNWQGIAQGDVNVLDIINLLSLNPSISSPSAVLTTPIEVADIISAAATVAQNNGNNSLATSLGGLAANIPSGTILLGDLLSADLVDGSLADFDINALSLVTGLIELYNYKNVLTTPAPITANIPLLGNVTVYAQVVEPPHLGCIRSGQGFFSAGVRLLLEVDLLPQGPIATDINILGLASVTTSTTLTDVSLYIDIARGDVDVNTVSSPGNFVGLSVLPGLARAAIGTIPLANFFNRSQDPFTALDFGRIANIVINVDLLVGIDIANLNLGLEVKGTGSASPAVINLPNQSVPFGPTTFGSSSTVIATLLNGLTTNSTYRLTNNSLLSTIVNPLIVALKNTIGTALFSNSGIVYNILALVVDPLLNATGIGIGQVIIGSEGIAEECFDFDDTPNVFGTIMSSSGPYHKIDPNIYLGTAVPSPDNDGMPEAFGDPVNNDDGPDGLIVSYGSVDGNNYSLTINATNNTGSPALLAAWIDFNGDGTFEADELASVMVPSMPGAQSIPLSWTISNVANLPESAYIRVRISTDPEFVNSPSSLGGLSDGEVAGELITFAILPVTLLKFDGKREANYNLLSWVVENEENFYGFEIQRSKDANYFEPIGFVQSSIHERSGRNVYSYKDLSSNQGDFYYRLRMVDLDEKFDYSKIILVNGQQSSGFSFYPNPALDQIRIDIDGTDEKDVLVEIFDYSGRRVLRNKFTNFDNNLIDLSIDQLNQGIYILSVTQGAAKPIHEKLVIQK